MSTKISKDAFEFLNVIRQDPKAAIPKLEKLLTYFKGKVLNIPGKECGLMTNEGPQVIKELIQFLQQQKPLAPLSYSRGLEAAAQDHVNDTGQFLFYIKKGPKGVTGHDGTDGSTMDARISRYGEWSGHVGENISYGEDTGEDVVIQLIIDDGVASRGHRKNCFSPNFNLVGIADGPHKKYKTLAVFDFAGEFEENGTANQTQQAQSPNQQKEAPKEKGGPLDFKDVAQQAFDYLNLIRQNPKAAIPKLEQTLTYFKGDVIYFPGKKAGLRTNEGTKVFKECIEFLKKQKPLPPLQRNPLLDKAAQDHVNDTGPKGVVGHTGADKSTMSDRIERYVEWSGNIGENISYGEETGEDIVSQLIVDDGVMSRGHRNNCFSPDYKQVGIAVGTHKQYTTQAVFDFASTSAPKGQGGSNPLKQNIANKLQQQFAPQDQDDEDDAGDELPEGAVSLISKSVCRIFKRWNKDNQNYKKVQDGRWVYLDCR
ncbi:hypothetical protein pb186bvf_020050 [Paramecium bursaria]